MSHVLIQAFWHGDRDRLDVYVVPLAQLSAADWHLLRHYDDPDCRRKPEDPAFAFLGTVPRYQLRDVERLLYRLRPFEHDPEHEWIPTIELQARIDGVIWLDLLHVR